MYHFDIFFTYYLIYILSESDLNEKDKNKIKRRLAKKTLKGGGKTKTKKKKVSNRRERARNDRMESRG